MGRWIAAARRDEGMALATVMAISAVLFILATTLVMLATQGQVNASGQLQRTEALQAADAGVSAYCYKLNFHPGDYSALSGSTSDATWTVTAVPPGPGSSVTVVTAIGNVPARNGRPAATRKVVASLRPGGPADYMFLFNSALSVGTGAILHGDVWSNNNIDNNGEITGGAYAVGTIGSSSHTGVFDGVVKPNQTPKVFSTVNFPGLAATATADGAYWGDSGTFTTTGTPGNNLYTHHYLGYNVVLFPRIGATPGGATITRIKSIVPATGVMVLDTSTPTSTVSVPVPDDGVLYFDDPIWLSGTYSDKLTIVDGDDFEDPNLSSGMSGMNPTSTATSKPNNVNSSVFLWDDLVSSDPSNPLQVCGVVAVGDISLTTDYPITVTPDNMTLQAAFISSKGAIHSDLNNASGSASNNVKHASLTLTGAFASFDSVGMVQNDRSAGWMARNYSYDNNLNITTPPNFPNFGDGTMHVQSWTEN
jgi:hypothetical protein